MNQEMFLGESKVTRSGQVTLNKKVREELGLDEGDFVVFKKENNRLFILPAKLKIKENYVQCERERQC